MLLADMGASVIRIDRPGGADTGVSLPQKFNLMNRSRSTIRLDLKSTHGVAKVLRLCAHADALFEGFRPGIMERLGLGPEECMAVNARLVYGRVTGWGQQGSLATAAGHDGNFAAISGALSAIGAKDGPPVVPLNLVADFGGGGAYLAIGLLAALLEAQRSGQGQVVDAAMVDGAASQMTLFYGLHAAGMWKDERGSNFLDGAAPFYRPYRTQDDKYIMICAIEPRFFAELLQVTGVQDIVPFEQFNEAKWTAHIRTFEEVFATKSRQQWTDAFAGTDACYAPVLSLAEAPSHPHNKERDTFVEIDGVVQPAPAPRFSRTPSAVRCSAGASQNELRDMLSDWGLSDADIDAI